MSSSRLSFFEDFEFDDEIASRESFVIEAETCTNYSDQYKLQVDTETPRYIAKFEENNYGYNFFKLFKKDQDQKNKLEWLADFETNNDTILTCKIVDQIGDFIYRSQLRVGKEFMDTLPCIQNGAHVYSSGIVLKKKSKKKNSFSFFFSIQKKEKKWIPCSYLYIKNVKMQSRQKI